MEHLRYSVAACQTDMPNPVERGQMRSNTDRILDIIDAAVAGSAPFLPVRLVVFPEFAHSAPVFPTVRELLRQLTVPIPNEHPELAVSGGHPATGGERRRAAVARVGLYGPSDGNVQLCASANVRIMRGTE